MQQLVLHGDIASLWSQDLSSAPCIKMFSDLKQRLAFLPVLRVQMQFLSPRKAPSVAVPTQRTLLNLHKQVMIGRTYSNHIRLFLYSREIFLY